MTIELDYEPNQRVAIIELKNTGIVTAILIDRDGAMYKVRYFHDGEVKETYFYSEELQSPTEKPSVMGFGMRVDND